jgi:hypothetical protein
MAKRRIPRYKRNAEESEGKRRWRSGRIPADLSKQAPNNSYGARLYYEDTPFTCIDCGKEEVWTAEQQQWWYEVARGPIYSQANRCRECRRKRRAGREAGVPPEQPISSIGELLKLVRSEIEPTLVAAGFSFESRNRPRHPGDRVWIDYKRGGQIFSYFFDHRFGRLAAELLEPSGDVLNITPVDFKGAPTRANVMATIEEFAAAVIAFLADMPPAA